MAIMAIYNEEGGEPLETLNDHEAIVDRLGPLGVCFERWEAGHEFGQDPTQDDVIAAYRTEINRLMRACGFKSVDVVSLRPDHPDREALRKKFLNEHTHGDFEVRFFVDGRGLFYIHADNLVYAILCAQGDLISVPDNVPHWFDMGARPDFKCIRLFTTPDGWVGHYTENPIASRFPDFDSFLARYA